VSDFELLGSVTIGQYFPTGSRLHRLHPAVKLASAAILLGALTATGSTASLAASMALLLTLTSASGIPVRFAMRGVRAAVPMMLLIGLLQVFAIPANDTGRVLATIGPVRVTTGDLHAAASMLLRFASLILLVGLTTSVTSTREMTHGIEILLAPASRIGLPGHELALMITVALRFLPILAMEAENIAKAQVSRGASFGSGRGGVLRRTRVLLPLLVPLFLAALRRAEMLALAMEARGYAGGRGRTRLARYRLGAWDFLALTAAFLWSLLLVSSRGFDPRLAALIGL
jgi:energy-coupling factor transport system permease protein